MKSSIKNLFKKYDYEFTKNERKILTTFCKQSLKQFENDNRFFNESRIYNSILSKLTGPDDIIKLTKDEKTKLTFSLEQNIKHLQKEIKNAWFIKKWLYKSLLNQYTSILNDNFKD